jgi:hypothetical protein
MLHLEEAELWLAVQLCGPPSRGGHIRRGAAAGVGHAAVERMGHASLRHPTHLWRHIHSAVQAGVIMMDAGHLYVYSKHG